MQPKVNYPASQIVAHGTSAPLNSSTTTVVGIPRASSGGKPAFLRIAMSAGAAYVRGAATATAVSVTTADTIVTANEALYLNCVGMGAVGALQIGATNVIMQVSPLEEGVLDVPTISSLA